MTDAPVELSGTTLLVGPSQVGKTRRTAAAFDAWLDRHGPDGVVILEFAPEIKRDGQVLGGRLTRFTTIPDDVWCGVLDAHAPRAESETEAESVALARDNAQRAARILDSAPAPRAVFVNDATIPLQHESFAVDRLTRYCDRADCAVLNAFDSDELGTDDPVSRRERAALRTLRAWADRTVELEHEDDR